MEMSSTKGRIIKKSSKSFANERRAKQVTSPEQWSELVDFLERHPDIALCTFITDASQRVIARRLWSELAAHLNSVGEAQHSVDQWRRVWKDMKYKVKTRLALNVRQKKSPQYMLNIHEQRVAYILRSKTRERNKRQQIEPEPESEPELAEDLDEKDLIDDAPIELEIDVVPDYVLSNDEDSIDVEGKFPSPTPPYQPIEQTDTQEESQMSIAKSLLEICQQNREILQYVRKSYQLKLQTSQKQQVYQSTKLALYRKKLLLMHSKLEMDKLIFLAK